MERKERPQGGEKSGRRKVTIKVLMMMMMMWKAESGHYYTANHSMNLKKASEREQRERKISLGFGTALGERVSHRI